MKGTKRQSNKIQAIYGNLFSESNSWQFILRNYRRGSSIRSPARWAMPVAGMFESLDDRCWKLRSVES